ncbi:hypothetical protein [Tenacibaculum maritimum]|nr:hypothetical protein [Tenacibaculum maritimum]MDB0599827.1 hypothetical protein [Tenacibaculum maritimum]MDB0610937.1 hypothetical protein [Tenacibaculum maritimum]
MGYLRKVLLVVILIIVSGLFASCEDDSEKLEENARLEEQYYSKVNFSGKDEEDEDKD